MRAIASLIVRFATENPSWGYCRIQGALKDVGHVVARTTVSNVLKANGIQPAPNRPSSWRSFLQAHWGQIAAMDFFTTEVWTPRGLKTFYVLVVIDLQTRRIDVAGITTNPGVFFMDQIARNLTGPIDGFLRNHRVLICDRDTTFAERFKRTLSKAGVEVVLTPRHAPNCNAYVERFILSIKKECLRKMVFFGERSFRHAVSCYVEHYHAERAHQGIGNEKIDQTPRPPASAGEIRCSERLGGLLKHYQRAA